MFATTSTHSLRPARLAIALAGLLGLMAPQAAADTHTWGGAFSQNFQGANNWSPTGVPIDGDTAHIGLSTANVFLSAATRVDNLSLSTGALLRTHGQTLKVDDAVTLIRSVGGEDTVLTLSSGASGIDLDAKATTLTNGAAIVMEPNSQWRVVESAVINPSSSVSGSGLIEITGVLGSGFSNNGTLTSQALTLRRATHAGSTFDLDGGSENGVVNVTGLLDLQTNLSDPFDGYWNQQIATHVSVVDFTLGPGGDFDFFSGFGPAQTVLQGRHLAFNGDVDVRLGTGIDVGEAQISGDTITFGDGATVFRSFETTLFTTGEAFIDTVTFSGPGIYQHFGDMTIRGNALVLDGVLTLGHNVPQSLTIEPHASLVVQQFSPLRGDVNVADTGLIDSRTAWQIAGSLSMGGPNAIIRTEFDFELTDDGNDEAAVIGTGRFETYAKVGRQRLSPGDSDATGEFYFERLELSGDSQTVLDLSPLGSDLLTVEGLADIQGGGILLRLAEQFSPTPGSVLPLLIAGSVDGTFGGAATFAFGSGPGEFLKVKYNADSVVAYAPLVGDANLDGAVSGADYTIWADNFGFTGGLWQFGDFNGDGLVSGADYTIWADHFGESVPLDVAVTPVPEPSSLGLAAVGLACLALRRLGRRGLALAAGCAIAAPAAGADRVWTGGTSQNFHTASNWTSPLVPGSNDNAIISLDAANVTLGAAAHVENLLLQSGAQLRTNAQGLLVDSQITLNENTASAVTLTLNSGFSGIDLETESLSVLSGAELLLQSNSQLRVHGTLTVDAESRVSGSGSVQIGGETGEGFFNGGLLIADNLELRRVDIRNQATFDLDGPTETGEVQISGLLELQAPLHDPFDSKWSIDRAAALVCDDFELGPAGHFDLFGAPITIPTTVQGQDLTFAGVLSVLQIPEIEAPFAHIVGASLTFTDTAQIFVDGNSLLFLEGPTRFDGATASGLPGGNRTIEQADDARFSGENKFDVAYVLDRGVDLALEDGASLNVLQFLPFAQNSIEIGDDAHLQVSDEVTGNWSLQDGTVRMLAKTSEIVGAGDFLLAASAPGSARLEGSGALRTRVFTEGPVTISPGLAEGEFGILAFDTLELRSFSVVELEIGGPASLDQLSIGEAQLGGGIIEFEVVNGFVPQPGDVFRVIEFDSTAGPALVNSVTFGSGPGQFLGVVQGPNHVSLYCPLFGDANLDGAVTGADYTIWADNYGQTATWLRGDFNGDNVVTGADYTVWADHYGQSVSFNAAITAVPEPGSGGLALAGVMAVLGRAAPAMLRRSRKGPWISTTNSASASTSRSARC